MKTAAAMCAACIAAFAQQANAPSPIPLTQPEAMELALIRSQMQTLQTQLENLRLRACMRVSATDCAGWSPDGAAVILRQPPQPAPIGTQKTDPSK